MQCNLLNGGYRHVFVPWNPSGSPWVLLVIILQEKKLLFLDPLQSQAMANSVYRKEGQHICNIILQNKFQSCLASVEMPDKYHQNNSSSCGVLVCHYAECIAAKKDLTKHISTQELRKKIYEAISGKFTYVKK